MPNPFESMKTGTPPEWETVQGQFACERCPRWLSKAQYHVEEKLLVWKCDNCGYISKTAMDLEIE